MSGTADRGPVSAATRRAWIALTVTGTVLLTAGVLIAAAGEAAAPGSERGIPGAVIAGGLLAGCGLLCGAGLLAAAAVTGLPGARGGPHPAGPLAAGRRLLPGPALARERPAPPAPVPAAWARATGQRGTRPLRSGCDRCARAAGRTDPPAGNGRHR